MLIQYVAVGEMIKSTAECRVEQQIPLMQTDMEPSQARQQGSLLLQS
jgi:hypothetical protein